jgi:hypothetical protein
MSSSSTNRRDSIAITGARGFVTHRQATASENCRWDYEQAGEDGRKSA